MNQISVVPDSTLDDKNTANIGGAAGDLFLSFLLNHDKQRVRVAMSCGKTLWALLRHVTDRLRKERDLVRSLKHKTIELYPTTLYADYKVSQMYPHALVTTLASNLSEILTDTKIDAYAPTLPTNFFKLKSNDRSQFIHTYKLTNMLDAAAEADIILVGLGVTQDSQYQDLLKSLEVDTRRAQKCDAEVAYIPVNAQGKEDPVIREVVVGLSVTQLRDIACRPGRSVIAFGGGKQKQNWINPLLNHPCYNNLIIDVGVARAWLESKPGITSPHSSHRV
jgi:DNA-binding transcriptional regulator LsrR (DeoR family)